MNYDLFLTIQHILSCRLVHAPNGDICASGHSVINEEDPGKSRYFFSVWDLKQRNCIREINLENMQADFNGKCGRLLSPDKRQNTKKVKMTGCSLVTTLRSTVIVTIVGTC